MRVRLVCVLAMAALTAACGDAASERVEASKELLAAGDVDGAIAALEEATRLDPDDPVAWNNLGTLHLRQGRHDRAMELYRRAIEADSDRLEPHYNLANLLMDAGRGDEALREYDAALAADDSRHEVHFNRAWALYEMGRFGDALEALERAREHGANDASVGQLEAAIRRFYTPPGA